MYDAFEAQVTKRVKASFVNENIDLGVFLGLLTWLPNAGYNYWAPYHTRCHLFTAHFAKKVPLLVSVDDFVDVLRSVAWTWSLWTPSAHFCLCSCCCLLLSLLFSFCSWSWLTPVFILLDPTPAKLIIPLPWPAQRARGPFLESPETLRAHFGWHDPLCVFKTKQSRGTKLCRFL